MDLKEVVGWDAENLDQRILNRLRHFPETGVVILAFEHVDFCERHVLVSLSEATPRRRGCPQHRPPRWAGTAQCPSSTSRGGWVFDWRGQIWAIPPVDEDFASGNEATVVGGEETDHLCDIGGSSIPPDRGDVGGLGEKAGQLGLVQTDQPVARRVDNAGTDRIDADVPLLEIDRPGARERQDGRPLSRYRRSIRRS